MGKKKKSKAKARVATTHPNGILSGSGGGESHNAQVPLTSLSPLDKTISVGEFNTLWWSGDHHYAAGQFEEAIAWYSKAILASTTVASLLGLFRNRALCYIRIGIFSEAIRDCEQLLALNDETIESCIVHTIAALYEHRHQHAGLLIRIRQTSGLYMLNARTAGADVEPFSRMIDRVSSITGGKKAAKLPSLNLPKEWHLKLWDDKKGSLLVTCATPPASSFSDSFFTYPESAILRPAPPIRAVVGEDQSKTHSQPQALPPLIPAGECLSILFSSENTQHSLPCIVDPDLQDDLGFDVKGIAIREKELGNLAFGKKNYEDSLVRYSRAIQLNPNEPVFYTNRALVYRKLNRYHECITDCSASINWKPTIKAYHHRASALVAIEEYYKAVQDYHKALQFDPRNTNCMIELHKCLVEVEERLADEGYADVEAIRAERIRLQKSMESLKKSETEGASSKRKADTYESLQKIIMEKSKSLLSDPCDISALVDRALAYQRLGELEKSLGDLRRACRLDPDNKDLREQYRANRDILKGNPA